MGARNGQSGGRQLHAHDRTDLAKPIQVAPGAAPAVNNLRRSQALQLRLEQAASGAPQPLEPEVRVLCCGRRGQHHVHVGTIVGWVRVG